MPLYPMLDDRMITPSAQNNDDPVWSSKQNKLAWQLYLGDLYGDPKIPYYAAPARAMNLKNLPPTLTYVGSVEPFKDETIDYVERLKLQGNQVHFKIFDGGYHAFDILSDKSEIAISAKIILRKTKLHENFKLYNRSNIQWIKYPTILTTLPCR